MNININKGIGPFSRKANRRLGGTHCISNRQQPLPNELIQFRVRRGVSQDDEEKLLQFTPILDNKLETQKRAMSRQNKTFVTSSLTLVVKDNEKMVYTDCLRGKKRAERFQFLKECVESNRQSQVWLGRPQQSMESSWHDEFFGRKKCKPFSTINSLIVDFEEIARVNADKNRRVSDVENIGNNNDPSVADLKCEPSPRIPDLKLESKNFKMSDQSIQVGLQSSASESAAEIKILREQVSSLLQQVRDLTSTVAFLTQTIAESKRAELSAIKISNDEQKVQKPVPKPRTMVGKSDKLVQALDDKPTTSVKKLPEVSSGAVKKTANLKPKVSRVEKSTVVQGERQGLFQSIPTAPKNTGHISERDILKWYSYDPQESAKMSEQMKNSVVTDKTFASLMQHAIPKQKFSVVVSSKELAEDRPKSIPINQWIKLRQSLTVQEAQLKSITILRARFLARFYQLQKEWQRYTKVVNPFLIKPKFHWALIIKNEKETIYDLIKQWELRAISFVYPSSTVPQGWYNPKKH